MLGNFPCFCGRGIHFSLIRNITSVLNSLSPDILSHLNLVHIACKDYQQKSQIVISRNRSYETESNVHIFCKSAFLKDLFFFRSVRGSNSCRCALFSWLNLSPHIDMMLIHLLYSGTSRIKYRVLLKPVLVV